MTRPRDALRACVEARVHALGWPAVDVVVERPADESHGDLATPVAMQLARPLRRPPREIAAELIAGLELPDEIFQSPTIAGPGFLNVGIAPRYLRTVIDRILSNPRTYGGSTALRGKTANVEFVSSNPTGPLHVGHARNAALGDAIASLLEQQGVEVTREYYFNDAGRQMDVLAASVHARYQRIWDSAFPFPEEGYQGAYISDLAEEMRASFGERFRGRPLDECLDAFRDRAATRISDQIRIDLERFRVRFDHWFNESTLYEDGRIEATLADLRAAGAVFEAEGAVWFRASGYGDEKDRVLVKQTGQPTYLLPDIAYHRDKHERGFDAAIDVWGADHHAYAVRMQAALRALGYPDGWLRTVIYQQVSLLEAGEEVRLSTRANRMVGLAELMDDIGVDVSRYFLVMRKGDSHMLFDLDLARKQSDDNPVFYVQYAHARIESVFSKLDHPEWDPLTNGIVGVETLTQPAELALLKFLDEFPDILSDAAAALEPHRVTDYLENLARRFHVWYHEHRILIEDETLARARLALARATQITLRRGLDVLGVSAPTSM